MAFFDMKALLIPNYRGLHMKLLTTILFAIFSLSAFSKTTIYSYYGTDKTSGVDFFYASSFGKQYNYCYDGLPEGVCKEVSRGEARIKREYSAGAHDYFDVVLCERDHDQVTVQSKLFDDYGANGEPQTAVFGMCD